MSPKLHQNESQKPGPKLYLTGEASQSPREAAHTKKRDIGDEKGISKRQSLQNLRSNHDKPEEDFRQNLKTEQNPRSALDLFNKCSLKISENQQANQEETSSKDIKRFPSPLGTFSRYTAAPSAMLGDPAGHAQN